MLLFPDNRVRVLLFRVITEVPAIVAVGMWFLMQVLSAVFDSGACTGTNLGQGGVTISGCASNRSYVRIMNPAGSPTGNPSVSTSDSRITTSLSSFSGGSVVAPIWRFWPGKSCSILT